MPLEAGTSLGHYTITAPLGAGGMGEVYRAQDTKLEREVAIKVLPEGFAADKERLSRFEREAKSLAALNHPNIATIHGFDQDGHTHFLVMELVEGEDLALRLKRGPIPVDEAIPLFIQIAEGLEAAHEKGIIHRDLKPANLKITHDGRVKILDFGLAKAMEPEPLEASPDLTQSPTMTAAATMRGEIMGTAAYMSPEQASGKSVDKRTDIWAFGVCLFEALSSQRAFRGEDAPNTLAAVLRDDLDFGQLPPDSPPTVLRLLERCLVRKRRNRLHDIADARLELREASKDPAQATAEPAARSSRTLWLASAATGLAGLALGALSVGVLSGDSEGPPRRSTHVRMETIDYPHGQSPSLAISPDGRQLVHVGLLRGKRSLFLQSLDSPGEVRPIEGTDFAANPFFSPDGAWVGFTDRTEHLLKKVPLDGGPAIAITSVDGFNPRGARWSEDGTIFYSNLDGSVRRVSYQGGESERATEPARDGFESAHWWPDALPEGRGLLFSTCCTANRVMALDFESGTSKVVVEDASTPRYATSGHLIFLRGSRLMAAPFDLDSLTAGAAIKVAEDVVVGDDSHTEYGVSQNGVLAFLSGTSARERRLTRVDTGTGERVLLDEEETSYNLWLDINPQGTSVALSISSQQDIFLFDLDRRTMDRITEHPANDFWPVFDRDGKGLTFSSLRAGHIDLWYRRLDANEPPRPLVKNEHAKWAHSRSSQGDLLFTQYSPETQHDLWILRRGETEPRLLVQSTFTEGDASFSPDGRWFVYHSDRSGRMEIYVQSVDDTSRRCLISTGGGQRPRWPRNDTIYYARGRTAVEARFQPDWPCEATTRDLFDGLDDQWWDVAPDGSFFVTLEPRDPPVLNLVFDFASDLRR